MNVSVLYSKNDIFLYHQDDLASDDVMILDTGHEVR